MGTGVSRQGREFPTKNVGSDEAGDGDRRESV